MKKSTKIVRRSVIVIIALAILTFVGVLSTTSMTAQARPLPYPPSFLTNSVNYAQMEDSLRVNTKLYNTSPRGLHSVQKFGTSKTNVRTTCPKNERTQIMWSTAGSSRVNVLDPGECLTLRDRTAYVIVVLDAR